MSNDYFYTLSDLRFDTLPTGDVPDDLREAIEGWIPRGKGVFARLENRWLGKESFDYILITEDFVYLAVLSHELQPRLLNMKCFKSSDMVAFAFMLEPAPNSEDDHTPQIRLMLGDGRRIKLMLDPAQKEMAARFMKELSTKNFFMC